LFVARDYVLIYLILKKIGIYGTNCSPMVFDRHEQEKLTYNFDG